MANHRSNTVEQYFSLLTRSKTDEIIDLFSADGFVVSPVLGRMNAEAFYRSLDAASAQNILTLHQVLTNADGRSFAAHFTYDWTLSGGGHIEFEGVDLFEFDDDDKIISMKIFYDTHPTRETVGDKYSALDET